MLCTLLPPGARIISVDLPWGRFDGGYPLRKIPLYHRFPKAGQRLHLIRADSHAAETKQRVLRILSGEPLDYLFLNGDHTFEDRKLAAAPIALTGESMETSGLGVLFVPWGKSARFSCYWKRSASDRIEFVSRNLGVRR